ncbi:MAG: hypothetical protein EPN20_07340 [Magnetospirillum sp.]|nr:MAG: hypothetical protein EPN20_07340 [Magnetospirillum sp.]
MAEENLFTYAGIFRLLADTARKIAIFPIRDWSGQPGIILRHDVDLDVEPALRFAHREAAAGLRASFFFLTTAETYNVSGANCRAMLREIDHLGMEVGLHFDPTIHGGIGPEEMEAAARREAAILEDIIGREVRSISLHNPSISGLYPLFPGWRNAYDPAIFSPDRYLSDSRMTFQSDPASFFADAAHQTYQLLLHPLHYSNDGVGYPTPMTDYVIRSALKVDAIFQVNSTYAGQVGGRFLHRLAEALANRVSR